MSARGGGETSERAVCVIEPPTSVVMVLKSTRGGRESPLLAGSAIGCETDKNRMRAAKERRERHRYASKWVEG
jgi:hypothetical protein